MKKSNKAREYLCQIPKVDRLITRLMNTLQTLRANITSINCELKPDKVQTSNTTDSFSETVNKIVDLEREIDARIDELVALKTEAFQKIKLIPDLDQQNVLIARYIQGVKWEDIGREFDHEIRWVYRVHNAGLISFMSVMDS